tara:strand:+ start:258 stop:662 length:405 start_codon:yes stop_codon:yes gene_type:complete
MQGNEEDKRLSQLDMENNLPLKGRDYEAINSDEPDLEQRVRNNLRKVVDPEIGINIVDLGLIYDVNVNEENDVQVLMTLTAPNCPFGEMILMESEMAVRSVKDVNIAQINLTFDPPWNPDQHVSDEAKYQMGIL